MPPAEGVTKHHAYRSYLQPQPWLGYKKDPTAWGWKERQNVIYPVHTLESLNPDELLSKISCRSETGCKKKENAVAENLGYDALKYARHVMVIVARTSEKP